MMQIQQTNNSTRLIVFAINNEATLLQVIIKIGDFVIFPKK